MALPYRQTPGDQSPGKGLLLWPSSTTARSSSRSSSNTRRSAVSHHRTCQPNVRRMGRGPFRTFRFRGGQLRGGGRPCSVRQARRRREGPRRFPGKGRCCDRERASLAACRPKKKRSTANYGGLAALRPQFSTKSRSLGRADAPA